MNAQALSCPKCRLALPDAALNTAAFTACPNCRTAIRCETFPALHAGLRIGRPGEPLVDASEASCFFHAEKRAAVACESCGRFLCALCDLEMDGRHICPSCLSAGRKKGALSNLDHFRLSFSGIGLLIAIVPIFTFWPMTIITAPAALVVLGIGLRKPRSLTGRRRVVTFIFAAIIAVAQIVGWIFFGKQMWSTFTNA